MHRPPQHTTPFSTLAPLRLSLHTTNPPHLQAPPCTCTRGHITPAPALHCTRRWESSGYFQPDANAPGEPFVISMPPPNVTGKLHMGHAMFVTLQDIMIRYARMAGRRALWLPGTDHAGIATQVRC
jgi:hypothetical protein